MPVSIPIGFDATLLLKMPILKLRIPLTLPVPVWYIRNQGRLRVQLSFATLPGATPLLARTPFT